jgi:hypothetical protein
MPENGDLPHVTAILKAAGLIDLEWVGDYVRDLGTAVHAATEYLDQGDLDWTTVPAAALPRVRQYQKFRDELKPEILAIEIHVVNETLRYQGRYDRLCRINGREGILDIKGPMQAPWQALQLVLYAATLGRPLARWTLHLSDDRYQLIEHNGRSDWAAARAAITLAAWRIAHGC